MHNSPWTSRKKNELTKSLTFTWLWAFSLTLAENPAHIFKGPMLWNNIPAQLREPMSINKFRKLIKLYLTTDSENWIFSCVNTMLRYCIVLMFYGYMQNAHYFLPCVWMRGWWDGWYFTIFRFCFTIFMFCFYWFFCINVRVLTMLAASIDGFLLFWQPASS